MHNYLFKAWCGSKISNLNMLFSLNLKNFSFAYNNIFNYIKYGQNSYVCGRFYVLLTYSLDNYCLLLYVGRTVGSGHENLNLFHHWSLTFCLSILSVSYKRCINSFN